MLSTRRALSCPMVSRSWAPSDPERFWKKSEKRHEKKERKKRRGQWPADKSEGNENDAGDQNGDKSGRDGVGKKDFDGFDIAANDAYQISRAAA